MDKDLSVRVKVTIRKNNAFFGPGIAQLIRLIDELGSVKEACQSMGLSYSKGWFIINRAETELGYQLIRRNHGGRDGGAGTPFPAADDRGALPGADGSDPEGPASLL